MKISTMLIIISFGLVGLAFYYGFQFYLGTINAIMNPICPETIYFNREDCKPCVCDCMYGTACVAMGFCNDYCKVDFQVDDYYKERLIETQILLENCQNFLMLEELIQ